MFLTDQWGSNQAHIYLGTHKNHKVFIDQLGLRAFLIVWILNAWNIQVNWLGANFLNEISLKSMWFCTTEPYTSSFYSFYGDIFVFFLLIVMESSEGVLRLSYLNLKVYASWNMLQHLFFLFLFCGRKISVCHWDCSRNGNRTCLVTSETMKVKLPWVFSSPDLCAILCPLGRNLYSWRPSGLGLILLLIPEAAFITWTFRLYKPIALTDVAESTDMTPVFCSALHPRCPMWWQTIYTCFLKLFSHL